MARANAIEAEFTRVASDPGPDFSNHRSWTKNPGNNPRYPEIQKAVAILATDSPGCRKLLISSKKPTRTTIARPTPMPNQGSGRVRLPTDSIWGIQFKINRTAMAEWHNQAGGLRKGGNKWSN